MSKSSSAGRYASPTKLQRKRRRMWIGSGINSLKREVSFLCCAIRILPNMDGTDEFGWGLDRPGETGKA